MATIVARSLQTATTHSGDEGGLRSWYTGPLEKLRSSCTPRYETQDPHSVDVIPTYIPPPSHSRCPRPMTVSRQQSNAACSRRRCNDPRLHPSPEGMQQHLRSEKRCRSSTGDERFSHTPSQGHCNTAIAIRTCPPVPPLSVSSVLLTAYTCRVGTGLPGPKSRLFGTRHPVPRPLHLCGDRPQCNQRKTRNETRNERRQASFCASSPAPTIPPPPSRPPVLVVHSRYGGTTQGTRGTTQGTRGGTQGTRGGTQDTRGGARGTRGAAQGTRGTKQGLGAWGCPGRRRASASRVWSQWSGRRRRRSRR